MKKRLGIISLIFSTIVILSSCEVFTFRCIDGNGVIIEQEREIDNFNKLYCSGSCQVNFEYDSVPQLIISGEENLIQYIETYVSGTKLFITEREGRCIKENEAFIITLKGSELVSVEFIGSGMIKCDSLNENNINIQLIGSGDIDVYSYSQSMYVTLEGSGNIILSGISSNTELHIPGSGDIEAAELITENCRTKIAGSGDMYIHVTDYLNVFISGSGNVYYLGNPEIDKQIVGSGKIIAIND